MNKVPYNDSKCLICCEDMNKDMAECRILDCLHIYHCKCIKKWIDIEKNCPICKNRIPFKVYIVSNKGFPKTKIQIILRF